MIPNMGWGLARQHGVSDAVRDHLLEPVGVDSSGARAIDPHLDLALGMRDTHLIHVLPISGPRSTFSG